MASAADFLGQTQNADGGWGYRVGGMSYVEPTAAVLLALRAERAENARQRGRDFLLSLQHADGGWGIAAIDSESGWMTAWAVRALAEATESREAVACGVRWLIATEGLRYTDAAVRTRIRELYRIDSTLRGWPWQVGDAAWVHPTALAMLALVAAGYRNEPRVREGVQYLFDRAVASGGWNIGNPQMIDKLLPATVQDTAVALLALRAAGESATEPRIISAIHFLRDTTTRAQTPAELAWGLYALHAWNADVSDALARLNALQNADGSWQGNPFLTAVAMRAWSEP